MSTKKYVDIDNVRSDEMRQKWQKIIDQGIDPFAPEHAEAILGNILTETDHWYAFANNFPYPGIKYQLVIVTKNFFDDDSDLPDNVWLDLKTIKKKLREQFQITGGGFVMRFGDTSLSGGSVVHLHAQLIVPEYGKTVAAWFGSKRE